LDLGYHSGIARLIADLEGREDLKPRHPAEAVGCRSPDRCDRIARPRFGEPMGGRRRDFLD